MKSFGPGLWFVVILFLSFLSFGCEGKDKADVGLTSVTTTSDQDNDKKQEPSQAVSSSTQLLGKFGEEFFVPNKFEVAPARKSGVIFSLEQVKKDETLSIADFKVEIQLEVEDFLSGRNWSHTKKANDFDLPNFSDQVDETFDEEKLKVFLEQGQAKAVPRVMFSKRDVDGRGSSGSGIKRENFTLDLQFGEFHAETGQAFTIDLNFEDRDGVRGSLAGSGFAEVLDIGLKEGAMAIHSDDFRVRDSLRDRFIRDKYGWEPGQIRQSGGGVTVASKYSFPKTSGTNLVYLVDGEKEKLKLLFFKDEKGWKVVKELGSHQLLEAHLLEMPGDRRTESQICHDGARTAAAKEAEKFLTSKNLIEKVSSIYFSCKVACNQEIASCCASVRVDREDLDDELSRDLTSAIASRQVVKESLSKRNQLSEQLFLNYLLEKNETDWVFKNELPLSKGVHRKDAKIVDRENLSTVKSPNTCIWWK